MNRCEMPGLPAGVVLAVIVCGIALSAEKPATNEAARIAQRLRETDILLIARSPFKILHALNYICRQANCDLYLQMENSPVKRKYPGSGKIDGTIIGVTNVGEFMGEFVALFDVRHRPAWDVLTCVVQQAGLSFDIQDQGVIVGLPPDKFRIEALPEQTPADVIQTNCIHNEAVPWMEAKKHTFDEAQVYHLWSRALDVIKAEYPEMGQMDPKDYVMEWTSYEETSIVTVTESKGTPTKREGDERLRFVRMTLDEKSNVVEMVRGDVEGRAEILRHRLREMLGRAGPYHEIADSDPGVTGSSP